MFTPAGKNLCGYYICRFSLIFYYALLFINLNCFSRMSYTKSTLGSLVLTSSFVGSLVLAFVLGFSALLKFSSLVVASLKPLVLGILASLDVLFSKRFQKHFITGYCNRKDMVSTDFGSSVCNVSQLDSNIWNACFIQSCWPSYFTYNIWRWSKE